MSERITHLRRRMIEDMTVRNLSPATQASYITAVKKFSRYHRRSPEQLGVEDVRAYQVTVKGVEEAGERQRKAAGARLEVVTGQDLPRSNRGIGGPKSRRAAAGRVSLRSLRLALAQRPVANSRIS